MRNDIGIGRLNGAVAQLVEQRTENPCVGGSIPPHTTKTSAAMLGFFVLYKKNWRKLPNLILPVNSLIIFEIVIKRYRAASLNKKENQQY